MKSIERVAFYNKEDELTDLLVIGLNGVADIIEPYHNPYYFYAYDAQDLQIRVVKNTYKVVVTYSEMNSYEVD
jgi:hypothetical protein